MAIFGAFEQAEAMARKHLGEQSNGVSHVAKNGALAGVMKEEEIEAEAVEYVDEMEWE
jgi:hypothetical protein